MDLGAQRELLDGVITGVGSMNTHETLADACESLGLPTPPEDGSNRHDRAGRRRRAHHQSRRR
jgi:hypothetical protein